MEERNAGLAPAERPSPTPGATAPGGTPHLADPRALTILTTEHWSLLSGTAFAAVLGLVAIMAVAGVRVFARAATAVEARFPGPEDVAEPPQPPAG